MKTFVMQTISPNCLKTLFGALFILASFSALQAQTGNTLLGNQAGQSITTSDSCTLIGEGAGRNVTSGLFHTFLGAKAGESQTGGSDNVFIGFRAGSSSTSSSDNTFIGTRAGRLVTTALDNVFIGKEAGEVNTTGTDNVFVGEEAGQSNTTGNRNVFVGEDAGFDNLTGNDNTFIGRFAGRSNTTGLSNTFIGGESYVGDPFASGLSGSAGGENTTGNYNTCLGAGAGRDMGTPDGNTMIGYASGFNTEHANQCTFVGAFSGWDNNRTNSTTNSKRNTYLGYATGASNREGMDNVGIGANADYLVDAPGTKNNRTVFIGSSVSVSANDLIAIGYDATVTANNSIALGPSTSVTGVNSIAIGYQTSVAGNNEVYIGNGATASIGGAVNWTATSDGRFKTDVRTDVPGLDFIKRLRPVTYQFDARKLHQQRGGDADGLETGFEEKDSQRYTGFIAQEVETAALETGYDFSGVDKPKGADGVYGLRYAEFSVPLVKSVQELDQKVQDLTQKMQEQQAVIDQLLSIIQTQQSLITELKQTVEPGLPKSPGTASVQHN